MGHVEVAHVSHTLPNGRVLLDDVSFRVGDGVTAALVGPNGAGKTTLLRLIAGDLTAQLGIPARAGALPPRGLHGRPGAPLAECVRDLVEERTGERPRGPVRLLTTLRTFGHNFNPVCFYYCFAPGGERVEAVVAQVTNTPWGETPLLRARARDGEHAVMRDTMDKAFHVSPFIGMDDHYDWRVTEPNGRLLVHIDERDDGGTPGVRRHAVARAPRADRGRG